MKICHPQRETKNEWKCVIVTRGKSSSISQFLILFSMLLILFSVPLSLLSIMNEAISSDAEGHREREIVAKFITILLLCSSLQMTHEAERIKVSKRRRWKEEKTNLSPKGEVLWYNQERIEDMYDKGRGRRRRMERNWKISSRDCLL